MPWNYLSRRTHDTSFTLFSIHALRISCNIFCLFSTYFTNDFTQKNTDIHYYVYNTNVHAIGAIDLWQNQREKKTRKKEALLLLVDSFDCLFVYSFVYLTGELLSKYTVKFIRKISYLILRIHLCAFLSFRCKAFLNFIFFLTVF